VQQELAMVRPAVEKAVVSRVELLRLERQVNDLDGELKEARLAVPRLRAAEQEGAQKVDQYVADFRAKANSELSDARADQSVVSANKVALEDRLDRTVVRAPVAGTVKQVKVNTVGGVVQPGMDLVEIVPADDALLVEARVRPADIAFLRPGLDAMVKLSAYDFSIYGGIEGVVDIVREEGRTTMYDIKTHDLDTIHGNLELYEQQLNVYAHIWRHLRGQELDETAIISTSFPSAVKEALNSDMMSRPPAKARTPLVRGVDMSTG